MESLGKPKPAESPDVSSYLFWSWHILAVSPPATSEQSQAHLKTSLRLQSDGSLASKPKGRREKRGKSSRRWSLLCFTHYLQCGVLLSDSDLAHISSIRARTYKVVVNFVYSTCLLSGMNYAVLGKAVLLCYLPTTTKFYYWVCERSSWRQEGKREMELVSALSQLGITLKARFVGALRKGICNFPPLVHSCLHFLPIAAFSYSFPRSASSFLLVD